MNLHQTIKVDEDMEIRAYYAGHVLGAAMFYIRVGNQSVVYTGAVTKVAGGPIWVFSFGLTTNKEKLVLSGLLSEHPTNIARHLQADIADQFSAFAELK